jgi:hypothetical protein
VKIYTQTWKRKGADAKKTNRQLFRVGMSEFILVVMVLPETRKKKVLGGLPGRGFAVDAAG